jgi:creatinine amidohydrolase
MIEEWDITATNLRRARQRRYEVAVLPVGAIEAHNYHLPFGQDFRHAEHVARASTAAAWRRTESVLCLPALPFGVDCNLMAYPLTVSVTQATLDAMLREIIASLRRHGIRKFVILNGHGGNDFLPLVRQLQCETDVHVFVVDWWKAGMDRYDEVFTRRDDHAGQFETSTALELYPDLVEAEHAADGSVRKFRFAACERGWAVTSRDFSRLSDHCASGNPEGASARLGRQYLDLVIARIADFLVELAQAPIDGLFPFVGAGG